MLRYDVGFSLDIPSQGRNIFRIAERRSLTVDLHLACTEYRVRIT